MAEETTILERPAKKATHPALAALGAKPSPTRPNHADLGLAVVAKAASSPVEAPQLGIEGVALPVKKAAAPRVVAEDDPPVPDEVAPSPPTEIIQAEPEIAEGEVVESTELAVASSALDIPDGPWNVDAETYHAYDGAVSNSMLKVFAESRRIYSGIFIEHTLDKPKKTDDMKIGSALHMMIGDPELASCKLWIGPEGDGRTKAVKDAWAEIKLKVEAEEGVKPIVLSPAQYDIVAGAYVELRQHPELDPGLFLRDGGWVHEQPVLWTHPRTGIRCRSMFDAFHPEKHIILDFKTAEDSTPEGFARACVSRRYDCQQAFYSMAYEQVYGVTPRFLFAVVDKSAAQEAAVYEMDKSFVEVGKFLIGRDMIELARCLENNDFSGRWSWGIQPLKAPKYHFSILG